jgi:hypothetical protein
MVVAVAFDSDVAMMVILKVFVAGSKIVEGRLGIERDRGRLSSAVRTDSTSGSLILIRNAKRPPAKTRRVKHE